jgi:predicted nucleotidyltransferase
MIDYEVLRKQVARHPYPLLFATISGAHLYGFPSPDSDYDLRGAHILPARESLGLLPKQETIESSVIDEGLEIDLVTHDAHKFFSLMLRRNGYVLEQLYSPLIVTSTSHHAELKAIGTTCITRHHSHHYLGFANTQWKLFSKGETLRVKPLLYVYRVLLTGVHLMRTGRIEANLLVLNEEFKLPYIAELVAYKIASAENATLTAVELEFHQGEYARLVRELESAAASTHLPEETSARESLHDLLIRVRRAVSQASPRLADSSNWSQPRAVNAIIVNVGCLSPEEANAFPPKT